MSKPRIFIGSSVESLPIADAIAENLEFDAEVTIWRSGTRDCWRKWLSRRSHTGYINWEKFDQFLRIWKLAEPKITKRV